MYVEYKIYLRIEKKKRYDYIVVYFINSKNKNDNSFHSFSIGIYFIDLLVSSGYYFVSADISTTEAIGVKHKSYRHHKFFCHSSRLLTQQRITDNIF